MNQVKDLFDQILSSKDNWFDISFSNIITPSAYDKNPVRVELHLNLMKRNDRNIRAYLTLVRYQKSSTFWQVELAFKLTNKTLSIIDVADNFIIENNDDLQSYIKLHEDLIELHNYIKNKNIKIVQEQFKDDLEQQQENRNKVFSEALNYIK